MDLLENTEAARYCPDDMGCQIVVEVTESGNVQCALLLHYVCRSLSALKVVKLQLIITQQWMCVIHYDIWPD